MRKLGDARVFLSALAACLLMLGQAVSYPLVLCVSATGHVAVETFNAGCCTKPSGDGSEVIAAHLDCDGCTDMSLETVSDSHARAAVIAPATALLEPPFFPVHHLTNDARQHASTLPSSSVPLRC